MFTPMITTYKPEVTEETRDNYKWFLPKTGD